MLLLWVSPTASRCRVQLSSFNVNRVLLLRQSSGHMGRNFHACGMKIGPPRLRRCEILQDEGFHRHGFGLSIDSLAVSVGRMWMNHGVLQRGESSIVFSLSSSAFWPICDAC